MQTLVPTPQRSRALQLSVQGLTFAASASGLAGSAGVSGSAGAAWSTA